MAKVCCICGKRFGMVETRHILDYSLDYELCNSCDQQLENLTAEEIEVREKAIEFANALLEKEELNSKLKNILVDKIHASEKYVKEVEENKKREEELKQQAIEAVKTAVEHSTTLTREHLMTSGYNFEGYRIVKYKGLVSGEIVLGTGFFSETFAGISDIFGVESDSFAAKMITAKKAAQERLIQQVIKAGGNAVIGVDYDYITFGNNMLGVSVNGTAVVVEKQEE